MRSASGILVVGAATLGLAVIAGCGTSEPTPDELAQRFVALQKERSPGGNDAAIRQSLDNGCNVTRAEGTSMGELVSQDPQFLPQSVTREEYVKIMDDYCASRG